MSIINTEQMILAPTNSFILHVWRSFDEDVIFIVEG